MAVYLRSRNLPRRYVKVARGDRLYGEAKRLQNFHKGVKDAKALWLSFMSEKHVLWELVVTNDSVPDLIEAVYDYQQRIGTMYEEFAIQNEKRKDYVEDEARHAGVELRFPTKAGKALAHDPRGRDVMCAMIEEMETALAGSLLDTLNHKHAIRVREDLAERARNKLDAKYSRT